jgi:D-alanine-D-alanine ligase
MSDYRGKRIGVLMGGWSSERDISLKSGLNVTAALHRLGHIVSGIDITRNLPEQIRQANVDVAFIVLHGKPGEDGTVQGFLELLGIPYTGSGVEASAIGIDKVVTKHLFQAAGIPTPAWVSIRRQDDLSAGLDAARTTLGFPMIVKPRYEGSSVGMAIIRSPEQLLPAVTAVREKFGDVLLEKFILGMIATVGILGEQALPILELTPRSQEFYDFKAKYTKGETEFVIPARLEESVTERIQRLALLAHETIGAEGFSRVDLMVEDGKTPYFLEVNTIPGMTDVSDLPAEAAQVGISYDELVQQILRSARKR